MRRRGGTKEKTAEEEYLESLWTFEDEYAGNAAQVPILAKSQVFQRSAQQDALRDQETGTAAISTLRPKPKVPDVVPMWQTVQGDKPTMRDAEELRREFDDVILNLEQRRDDFEAATLEVNKARAHESKIEGEIHNLLDEEGALLVKQPPATERIRKVRLWLAGCEAALAEQREMVEARELEVEAAAARLRAAEAELDFLADARQV
ncbi:hypothetical protein DUNSADRAFT_14417 [Dunaliella salina]|uniref:Uncharacterized protein n=1 Tax=Dunaliella salina TaxID=3046 RepID=A0ABQ7H9H4_DUNSA|nr:hypothetical protein DUNSADRAFT_14417 [Dunaliella salina]|eukprot:KAF5843501.1 hypothetical protein DUNSADRAFT_14417 [Dunaliella salina]